MGSVKDQPAAKDEDDGNHGLEKVAKAWIRWVGGNFNGFIDELGHQSRHVWRESAETVAFLVLAGDFPASEVNLFYFRLVKISKKCGDPVIYREAPFAIVPLARSSPAALALTGELVQAIDARPLLLDAATHDAWTAATSHFPYLMAAALVLATPSDAAPLVGSGFRSTARVAGSSVPMMMDILTTNRANVLAAIQRDRKSVV